MALAPRHLITFDQINFALAIDQFDPALHQPQPPGYPLFVGLLKLLALVIPGVESVFLAAALLSSAAALFCVWRLSERIAGPDYGVAGALLLLFNPPFWLSALTNPVRLTFAAGASGVALCAWIAIQRKSPRWIMLAAATAGLAAGFRPTLAVLCAPLVIWAAWHIRLSWKAALAACLCCAAMLATWSPFLIAASGGWRAYIGLLQIYSDINVAGSSPFFGAPLPGVLEMSWKAVVWTGLGSLSWLWALPLARRSTQWDPTALRFLALWFFPGLLFYATVHVGDPDHTLSIVPATCVAGALALAALVRRVAHRARVVIVTASLVCAALNVALFFHPLGPTAWLSTIVPVRAQEDYMIDVVDGIGGLQTRGPVTAVFYDVTSGWRQLSYYHPHAHIVVVKRANDGSPEALHIVGRDSISKTSSSGIVALPACGTLAWFDPQFRPVAKSGAAFESVHSRLFFLPANPGESFEFRGFRFVAGEEECRSDFTASP